ncbi:TPA: restriction endonuclease subunit S [Photobacterium damselae]
MNCNWQLKELDQVITKRNQGVNTTTEKVKYSDDGVIVLRANNITQGNIDFKDVAFVDEETFKRIKEPCKPRKGDVLYTNIGSQFGNAAKVEADCDFVIAWNVLRLQPNQETDADFLVYLLNNPSNKAYIQSLNSSSTMPFVSGKEIGKTSFNFPDLHIQRKIGNWLKSLDNKIYLNTQTNQTLEQMAQAIFKSWFVDFDPVKAKMNGEQPEGMDAATASLFPEKLDGETGIPAGWSQGVISDIAKLNAKSWTKKNQPEQVNYVDLANTKNGVIETVTTYDFDEAPSRARRVLNSGDTIVGTVRPGNRSFAFIGKTEQPLTGSTGFAVLSPKEEFWTSFVYLATTNDDSIDEYARLADGGAYPAIKPVVVADTPCVIPTTDIAQKFWQLTGAMLKKAHQNRLENEELAKLRDTLLPKLLSGEIELGSED